MDTGRLIRTFTAPLPPLPKAERIGVAVLALLVAITRWPAIAKTLWDWDEALFVLALRDYDVVAYHPHPPGFPLFVGLAKLIPLDAFHALQTVVVLAALFVFPAAFFLARELRANTFVATASALILAFLPNVWFYGGTAFSDVPSLVLSLLACALLLRGCRDERMLLIGCAVLGLAAAIRPQNLLIGFAPFAIAFLARRNTALRGLIITAAIVIVSYGAAAAATGSVAAYFSAIAEHGRYIRRVDSFLSDIRPSLFRVFDDFFLRPFRAPLINIVLLVLAAFALWRRRAHTIAALAIFGPFLLFAWLFLDFHSASRFSIAYMPLFAILAADGLELFPQRLRLPLLAAFVAVMFVWTFPVLQVVRSTEAPPVAAMRFVRTSADPVISYIEVDEALGPHAEVFLQGFERATKGRRVVVRVAEGKGDQTFTRPRERLAGIVRPRYFEVSVGN
jgi:Glycosyltransferase family 87